METTKSIAERRAELEARLDAISDRQGDLQNAFSTMKRDRDELEGDVAYAQEQLEEAEKKLEELVAKWDEMVDEDHALEDEKWGIDDELDLLKETGN